MEINEELDNLYEAYMDYKDTPEGQRKPVQKQNLMNCYNIYRRPKLKETHWTCPACMDRVLNETLALLIKANKI